MQEAPQRFDHQVAAPVVPVKASLAEICNLGDDQPGMRFSQDLVSLAQAFQMPRWIAFNQDVRQDVRICHQSQQQLTAGGLFDV